MTSLTNEFASGTISPYEVVDIFSSLAELELFHARQLIWNLPTAPSFEAHCMIGLAIGSSGRRIDAFLRIAGENMIKEVAPSPPSEWEQFIERGKSEASDKHMHTFRSLYKDILSWVTAESFRTYDAVVLMKFAMSLKSRYDNYAIPLKGPSDNNIDSLIQVSNSRKRRQLQHPTRARRNNIRKKYDKRWQFVNPGFAPKRIKRIEYPEGLMHKLHHTAFRESLATECSALSMYEYDGLPWSFYIDMARQCEDEARHSLISAERFRELGGKLGDFPLSHFGNFYQMFWEMDLTERLVAMNLDTEAMGQVYLGELGNRVRKVGDKSTSQLFEYLGFDEKRHARFGGKWLAYLYSNPESRKEAIESCRALTAINLASAEAYLSGRTVGEVIDRWITLKETIPQEPQDDHDSDEYEKEISLLAARQAGYEFAEIRKLEVQ